MVIRQVSIADFPTLAAMYKTCFREPPWFEEFTTEEILADFEKISEWSKTIFLVAEIESRVVGGVIAYDLKQKKEVDELVPDNQSTIYTAEVFVDPHKRGYGIAKTLIFTHLALARIGGFTHLAVRTSIEQPIIHHIFCQILGAVVVAEQNVVSTKVLDGVPQKLPDKRIIMSGRIPEIVLTKTLRAV